MLAFVLTGGLILLLILGIPVGFSLTLCGAIGYMLNMGAVNGWMNMSVVPLKMSYSLQNFLLLSIPLFVLAAKIMNSSSITKRIFSFANNTVGWLPGGLAHANIFASLLFAGMSGTAVSDAAGLGQIEISAMTEEGYDADFAAGVTAASSTIGPIFPPSVPMVMYSTISGVSVGSLFLGGVVPGILMTLTMMVLVIVMCKKKHYKTLPFPGWKIWAVSFRQALLPLLTPVILLFGIWSGVFTATESAVIAATYALFVSAVVYKEMSFRRFVQILKETAHDTANIGFVVAAAAFYGWVLARSGLTVELADWLLSISSNKIVFMLLINVFFLIIGCFLESIAAIMIFGPIFLTPAMQIGIDPLAFGLVIVLNLMIGLITPPFGIVLFITQDLAKIDFSRMVKSVAPYFFPLFGVLILLTFCPQVATFLPAIAL